VIYRVADELEKAGISYSFDASTSLFVHGIEFDMDDVDVTVEWNCLADAHTVFLKYGAAAVVETAFSHFHFFMDKRRVHILSSERITDLGRDPETPIPAGLCTLHSLP